MDFEPGEIQPRSPFRLHRADPWHRRESETKCVEKDRFWSFSNVFLFFLAWKMVFVGFRTIHAVIFCGGTGLRGKM